MSTNRVINPAPRPLLLFAFLMCCLPATAQAQPDSAFGTWKLNAAKSKFAEGTAPTSTTVTIEAAGQAIKVTTRTVRMSGKVVETHYTAYYDGMDYPVEGTADYDTVSLKRNGMTVEGTRKKNGKVVQLYQRVISEDRKTMTVATTGIDAEGHALNSVAVYERR
jgi:hypothetical protein